VGSRASPRAAGHCASSGARRAFKARKKTVNHVKMQGIKCSRDHFWNARVSTNGCPLLWLLGGSKHFFVQKKKNSEPREDAGDQM
jgi:hypothetical protein